MKKDTFTFTRLLFSCLIGMARTSYIMMKRNGENTYSCVVLNFRSKALNLSSLSVDVGWRFFIDKLYQVEKTPFNSLFAKSFYQKCMLDFVKCFYAIYWGDNMVFFFFFSLLLCELRHDFQMLNQSFILGTNLTWSWRVFLMFFYFSSQRSRDWNTWEEKTSRKIWCFLLNFLVNFSQ